MKWLISLFIMFDVSCVYALRCGTELINIGDSYSKIFNNCAIYESYRVVNQNADIVRVYIKQAGMTYQLTVIDGVLKGMIYGR